MKWKPRLKKLQGLEYDEEYKDAHHKAALDASSWASCAVAEKMLSITKAWGDLGNYGRLLVLEHQYDLCDLGTNFMYAVKDVDYERAIRLHAKIQKFSFDKLDMESFIKSHT